MEDKYAKSYIRAIKECQTDEDLAAVIDKIYSDGFADGEAEAENNNSK